MQLIISNYLLNAKTNKCKLYLFIFRSIASNCYNLTSIFVCFIGCIVGKISQLLSKPYTKMQEQRAVEKTALDNFNRSSYIIDVLSDIIGLRIFHENFQKNLRTYIFLLFMASYGVIALYTTWYYADNALRLLQAIVCTGVAIPVRKLNLLPTKGLPLIK